MRFLMILSGIEVNYFAYSINITSKIRQRSLKSDWFSAGGSCIAGNKSYWWQVKYFAKNIRCKREITILFTTANLYQISDQKSRGS